MPKCPLLSLGGAIAPRIPVSLVVTVLRHYGNIVLADTDQHPERRRIVDQELPAAGPQDPRAHPAVLRGRSTAVFFLW